MADSPSWIWTPESAPARNAFVRFRRSFANPGGPLTLKISADSRYWLYVDGEYLGTGPVRSWPNHWKFDEYQLPGSKAAQIVIAVLVNHLGEGNFQYIPAGPGLWVELCSPARERRVPLAGRGDAQRRRVPERATFEAAASLWKSSVSRAHVSAVPRISVQEGFEEQCDARGDDDWTQPEYEDSGWPAAQAVAAPHPALEPRGIPFLATETAPPRRILRAEKVRPASQVWNLWLKPYFAPGDTTSNGCHVKGFAATQIWSSAAQMVTFLRPHHHWSEFKLNGKIVPAIKLEMITARQPQRVRLKAGWNQMIVPYSSTHFPQLVVAVSANKPLRWAARGERGGSPWAFAGPFARTPAEDEEIRNSRDYPYVVQPKAFDPAASAAAFDAIYGKGVLTPEILDAPYFQEMDPAHIAGADVAGAAMADVPAGSHEVKDADALLSDNAAWAELAPAGDGCDVRVLIDFGREVVGHHVIEVDAAEGTIIDFHNFEFIQADGAENYPDGMNNSLRYICREGRQSFRSLQRRGFQYSWLIARNLTRPLRIRRVAVEFSAYPQARRGSFACSDSLLNAIWETGAHTLRCCAEDTYVDCPTYEQTHWVGDAANEALIDWVINGDGRLWFRCLEQTGQSLEHSDSITLSNVPSAWTNVLPAWSFLWMRSCSDYLLWTGDFKGAAILLGWVERNVDRLEKKLNARGLFEIQAWNMVDWAAMDTPDRGIVTHQNCFAVLALKDCARLADWLGKKAVAKRFLALAAGLAETINRHLWDEKRRAYLDCIHADGIPSKVFSQQTQTVAVMSGVASGARARRCREIIHRAPKGFVKPGSPFFEFFLLETLAGEGRAREFLDVIRRDWGFMIDQGATAFWEMWSIKSGRLTRSHCHGWSAAPTFFLSSRTLGVRPTKPGFAECVVEPQLGDLTFARGSVPTPRGLITVACERVGSKVKTAVSLPPGVKRK